MGSFLFLILFSLTGYSSELYFKNGQFSGSLNYWNAGEFQGSRAYWDNGEFSGSKLYWQNNQYLGSRKYWESGEFPGSRVYWNNGDKPGSRKYWHEGKFSSLNFGKNTHVGFGPICMGLIEDQAFELPAVCNEIRSQLD